MDRALGRHRGPMPVRAVVAAAGQTWTAGPKTARQARRGADLNGSYRNDRAPHALLQSDPHAGERATPARRACLDWLLAHGPAIDPPSTARGPSS